MPQAVPMKNDRHNDSRPTIGSLIQRPRPGPPALLPDLLILILLVGAACRAGKKATEPIAIDTSSKPYADVVQAFYVGLAALQVG
jgi:hypothetical protein